LFGTETSTASDIRIIRQAVEIACMSSNPELTRYSLDRARAPSYRLHQLDAGDSSPSPAPVKLPHNFAHAREAESDPLHSFRFPPPPVVLKQWV